MGEGDKNGILILVTNDDGVRAEGIERLRRAMSTIGEVIVVAPETQKSGASHALTLSDPLRSNRIDANTLAVDGTPTDCVLLAMRGLLDRKPDLVISVTPLQLDLTDYKSLHMVRVWDLTF